MLFAHEGALAVIADELCDATDDAVQAKAANCMGSLACMQEIAQQIVAGGMFLRSIHVLDFTHQLTCCFLIVIFILFL